MLANYQILSKLCMDEIIKIRHGQVLCNLTLKNEINFEREKKYYRTVSSKEGKHCGGYVKVNRGYISGVKKFLKNIL